MYLADDTSGSMSAADYGHGYIYLADDSRCQWRITDMGIYVSGRRQQMSVADYGHGYMYKFGRWHQWLSVSGGLWTYVSGRRREMSVADYGHGDMYLADDTSSVSGELWILIHVIGRRHQPYACQWWIMDIDTCIWQTTPVVSGWLRRGMGTFIWQTISVGSVAN